MERFFGKIVGGAGGGRGSLEDCGMEMVLRMIVERDRFLGRWSGV